MKRKEKENGQSVVELVLLLPFLLLLLIATVEAGFALRDYLMAQAANREGARLAVRTPPGLEKDMPAGEVFRDYFYGAVVSNVFTRILEAAEESGLRRESIGIILTHIYVNTDGEPTFDSYTYLSDFPVSTRLGTGGDIQTMADEQATKTARVNTLREGATYESLDNEIIVVEVFYAHRSLWFYDFVGPLGGAWVMYTQSTMRMVGTGRY